MTEHTNRTARLDAIEAYGARVERIPNMLDAKPVYDLDETGAFDRFVTTRVEVDLEVLLQLLEGRRAMPRPN